MPGQRLNVKELTLSIVATLHEASLTLPGPKQGGAPARPTSSAVS